MRLARMVLDCYGCFEHQELDLDVAPGRINLLVAANGAGKSVLRRAFGDLLFDLGHQSPMTFAYPPPRLRLSAEALLAKDGSTRTLVRRKGRDNTLTDGVAAIPSAELRAMLGGADAELFRDLFALDTAGLRAGGEALSHANGRLGKLLLAGSGGFAHVQRLLTELAKTRDDLGRAEHLHKARPLGQARLDFIEAEQRLRATALRPDAWRALERTAREAGEALALLRAESVAVGAELQRRRAVRAVRPWLARRDDALTALAEASGAPRLDADFEGRWRAALASHVATTAAAEQARLAAEAAAVDDQLPPHALIDAAERIAASVRDAGTAEHARAALPAVEEEHARAATACENLRRELGWPADQAVPPPPVVRAARALLQNRTGLLQAAAKANGERDGAEERLADARAMLDALPPAEDTAGLAALVDELTAAGEPARRLEAARVARRDQEAALQAALVAVPGRPVTRADLAGTAAPAEAALAAAEGALRDAETALRDAARARDTRAAAQAEAQARLAALTERADLPATGALGEARSARDALWDAALSGTPAAVVAYERALRHADAVADRLIAHATQAAEAESIRRGLAEAAAQGPSLEEAVLAATARFGAAEQALAALAVTAGAAADIPAAALRAFLAARQRALDTALALERATVAETDLVQLLNEGAHRLAALGVPKGDLGADLTALLETAKSRVAAARDARLARKAAEEASRAAERNAVARRAAAAKAAEALAGWQEEWRAAAAPLARPAGETPEATAAALDLIEDLRRESNALATARAQRDSLKGVVARFEAGVAQLVATLAPDIATLPPGEAARRLQADLDAQREALTNHAARVRARDATRADAAHAAREAGTAATALAALRAALGVTDDAAAETRLAEVRRATDARLALAEAISQIATLGGGRDEAELATLAATDEPAAEKERIDTLESRQAELGPALQAAAANEQSAIEARDRTGEADAPQEAAAAREAARAALARHAEEALVLHAATSLLRAALDAGHDDAGPASRVGAVFRALTSGAYQGVRVEEDGTDRVLVAVEADGQVTKPIDALSDGTQDQLFLALRIAALEDYVRTSPALPFIADDLLQTFDDTRAEAALRALIDLSQHVQVIVLTHHPHVATLARRLPAGAVHALMLAAPAEAA